MANEFVARNGLTAQDTSRVTGSFLVTGGNVGIGTSTLSQRLVVGTSDSDAILINVGGKLYFRDTSTQIFEGSGLNLIAGSSRPIIFSADGSERMRIALGGNVGIGTTSPAYKLDVSGSVRVLSGILISPLPSSLYATDGTLSNYQTTNGVYLTGNTNGWLRLNGDGNQFTSIDLTGTGYSDPNVITFKTNNSERARISSTGNVGIGTAAPSSKLQVFVTESASGAGGFTVVGNTNSKVVALGANSTYSFIQSHGSVPLYINELGNNLILNANAGSVGIGITSPSYKLDVSGSIRIPNSQYIYMNSVAGTAAQILGVDSGDNTVINTPTGGDIYIRSAGTTIARFISSGTVHLGGTSATSAPKVAILTGGSVGIGTTSPAYLLDVSGSARVAGSLIGDSLISAATEYRLNNLSYSRVAILDAAGAFAGGYNFKLSGTTPQHDSLGAIAGYYYQTAGSISFYTGGSQAANTNATARLVIDSSGSVGIGTTTPGARLDVNGSAYFGASDQVQIVGADNGGLTYYAANGTSLVIKTSLYTNPIVFQINSVEKVRISSSGSLGIGTNSPSFSLDVSGSGRFTDGLQVTGSFGATAMTASSLLVNGTITAQTLVVSTVSSSVVYSSGSNIFGNSLTNVQQFTGSLRVTGSGNHWIMGGNVGINTASPVSTLSVIGPDASTHTISWANQNRNTGYLYSDGGGVGMYVGTLASAGIYLIENSRIDFRVSGSERVRIDSNGNVGINTTSPTEKLNVVGNVNVTSGEYRIYNNSTILSSTSTSLLTINAGGFSNVNIANGNVGIGSSSPGAKLDINGNVRATSFTGSFSGSAAAPGANTQVIFNSSGSLSVSSGFVFTGANVGIGTTTPTGSLQVSGSSNTVNFKGSGSSIFSVDGTAGRLFQVDDSLSGSLFSVNTAAGLPVIEAFSDNTVRIGQFGQRALFVSQSRVGIGLENPTANLHVSGTTGGVFEVDGANAVNALYVSSSGNVGIGTTSPIAKLHINPSTTNEIAIAINGTQGYTNNNFQRIAVGDIASINRLSIGFGYNSTPEWTIRYSSYHNHEFYTGNDWGSSTEKMRITSTGNVGIGTTSPTKLLHVYTSANEGIFLQGTGGGVWMDMKSAGGSIHSIGAQNNGMGIYNRTTGSYRFFITDIGNVGIGSESPGAKLDVNGNVRATSFTGSFSGSAAAPGSNTQVIFNSSGSLAASSGFIFNGTSVGIGTTAPDGKLHVFSSTAGTITPDANSNLLVLEDGISNGMSILTPATSAGGISFGSPTDNRRGRIIYDHSADKMQLYTAGAGNVRMTIDNAGNVGIGTTTPATILEVSSNAGRLRITQNTAGSILNGLELAAFNGTVYGGLIGNQSSGEVRLNAISTYFPTFYSNGSEVMRIATTGNVGIGTTAPGSKLTVIGDIATSTRIATDTINGYTGGSTALTIQTGGAQNIIFGTNATERMRLDTNGNLGIGASVPIARLHAGINLSDYSSQTFTNTGAIITSIGVDHTASRTNVLSLMRDGTSGVVYAGLAAFDMSRWSADGVNARTQLDIRLANTDTATITDVLSLRSNGTVGINTTAPTASLDVLGTGNYSVSAGGASTTATALTLTNTNDNASNGVRIAWKQATATYETAYISSVREGANSYSSLILATSPVSWNSAAPIERMRITSAGNVAINTTVANYKFQVNTAISSSQTYGISIQQGTNGANKDAAAFGIAVQNSGEATNAADLLFATATGGSLSERMRITSGGNVGIGSASPAYALDVNGTGRFTAVIETSTREKKDNIQPYSTDINKFKQLEPVSFTWKGADKQDVGLIAEDVDKLFPEFVSKTQDGEVTGINYGKLTIVLINILKEQQERIERLEEQINK